MIIIPARIAGIGTNQNRIGSHGRTQMKYENRAAVDADAPIVVGMYKLYRRA
jgi:hypothetical protein